MDKNFGKREGRKVEEMRKEGLEEMLRVKNVMNKGRPNRKEISPVGSRKPTGHKE